MNTKKLHEKILFLISLPKSQEFEALKDNVTICINKLRDKKVEVRENFHKEDLTKISQYDIVIVMAHHDKAKGVLALSDSDLKINDFINSIPNDFRGILDFSSCYSASVMQAIKERCPNCLVQASIQQTSLALRLLIYPHVIDLIRQGENINYYDAYMKVLNVVQKIASEKTLIRENEQDSVKLGGHYSSIYAPKKVKKRNPFFVQVFLHNEEENVDSEADLIVLGEKTKQIISIKLKRNAQVAIRLLFVSPEKDLIRIEDCDTKRITWTGKKEKIVFCATVDERFSCESFVGKVLVEVDSVPQGECYFPIEVAEEHSAIPAETKIIPYDKMKARNLLTDRLNTNLTRLKKEMEDACDSAEKEKIANYIRICELCIDIVEKASDIIHNDNRKTVFISSTSDLKDYRDVSKEMVIQCSMYPEMYENWPQTDMTPSDECCRRVLASDVLVCILGPKYGNEPRELGVSMTEMEYRTAMLAGKSVDVYILNNELMRNPNNIDKRQKELIDEINNTRLRDLFISAEDLRTFVQRNLKK